MNLERMIVKPGTGEGSKLCVSWKVEEAVCNCAYEIQRLYGLRERDVASEELPYKDMAKTFHKISSTKKSHI